LDGLVNRWGKKVARPIAGAVLAFCGIARPEPFFNSLRLSGADVATMTFGDHHAYSARDLGRITARAAGQALIITTEKDLVRLDPKRLDERWHALRVRMDVDNLETMVEEIEARAEDRRISR
jgi:tetraacyldisaccharide 4'-kinase